MSREYIINFLVSLALIRETCAIKLIASCIFGMEIGLRMHAPFYKYKQTQTLVKRKYDVSVLYAETKDYRGVLSFRSIT